MFIKRKNSALNNEWETKGKGGKGKQYTSAFMAIYVNASALLSA